MNSKFQWFLLLVLAPIITAKVEAADPAPAPMLAEPYFDRAKPNSYDEVSISDFSVKYLKANKPPIMVVFGRSFSGFVSDWYADKRLQINTINKGNKTNSTLPDASSTDISLQVRDIEGTSKSALLNSAEWLSLEEGFRETLLGYRVGIVNQNLATRLLDAKLRDGEKNLPLDDFLRTEMDVLRHHSQYLIEIVPYQEANPTKQAISFKISISSMANAHLLAEKKVVLHPPAVSWRATSAGYKLQQQPQSIEYQAGEKGYDSIEIPVDPWYENGQRLAKALVTCLYQAIL